MKKKLEKIVFFGNERLATGVSTDTPILRGLISEGYDVVCVVTSFEPNQSRIKRVLEVEQIAKDNNIPLLTPKNVEDIYDELRNYSALAGLLVAYGQIIPSRIIDIFPAGIINIHPSLLPLHRGPTPIESAILSGDKKTGVSIMKLSQKMDAGPVFAQSELPLADIESKQELSDKLSDIGQAMLITLLPDILNGTVEALPQDESRASYDQLINKSAGRIDWNMSAESIERQIRAYNIWPKSQAKIGELELIINMAKVSSKKINPGRYFIENNQLFVGCASNSIEILELTPAGKSTMSAQSFLAGYASRLG